jgi:tetratricopeptide (TPR) repeat protein
MYSHQELGLESQSSYEAELVRLTDLADGARSADDATRLAAALLALGRIHEKLGRFTEAVAHARAARELYEDAGDQGGLAECRHTMAVWAFHQGDTEESFHSFEVAARLREDIGELLRSAQSWHNLGYVQCRSGTPRKAFACYAQSGRLLDRVRTEQPPSLGYKAYRDRGFLLSHTAFATAKHGDADEAVHLATEYFELVARTGVHREPLLAYLALPISRSRVREPGTARQTARLTALTGLPPDPESWFRFTLSEGRRALAEHRAGEGRRPYLGARLVALAEYGRWCAGITGRRDEGRSLMARAVALADARGWKGESERFSREYLRV